MKAEKDGIKFELMPTENKKLKSFELENPDEYFSNSLKNIFYGDKVLIIDYFFPGIDLLEYYLKRIIFQYLRLL